MNTQSKTLSARLPVSARSYRGKTGVNAAQVVATFIKRKDFRVVSRHVVTMFEHAKGAFIYANAIGGRMEVRSGRTWQPVG